IATLHILRPSPLPLFPYPTLFRSDDFLLFDPLSVPDELRERATAVVLTAPYHERDARRLGLPVHTPPADTWRPSRRASRSWYGRSEEHTSELQSRGHLVCRLLLEK